MKHIIVELLPSLQLFCKISKKFGNCFFFQGKPSPERFAPLQETVEEEKTSNQYTEGLFSFHCSH